MSETITTQPDGANLPVDSIAQTLQYSGSNLLSITAIYEGNTYVQTFSYTGLNLTAISGWVKQ